MDSAIKKYWWVVVVGACLATGRPETAVAVVVGVGIARLIARNS